ncbi:MAG: sulfite exporter TauE/SafE family protein [Ramlibacter sp.]
MDAESLSRAIQSTGYAAAGLAFLVGLLFSFNPVAMASIPVSLAYVTRAREGKTAVAFGAMFILGLVLTHVVLGVIAGLGGKWVQGLLGREWGLVLGPLLILLGVFWAGWIRIPLPQFGFKAKRATGLWGAFALGVPFAVAVCPACTPVLVVMLGVVAGLASPLLGATLLLAFALGRAVPIALGAAAIGTIESRPAFAKYIRFADKLGAIVLIAMGLYMLNAYYFLIPELAA